MKVKVTEFQKKTYEKTVQHISAFIPDDGITSADCMNVIKHCVQTMPDNELDALFAIGCHGELKKPDGTVIKCSDLFSRDKKEVGVALALLDVFVKNCGETR